MIWMLEQPTSYTGQIESMVELAHRTDVMPTIAAARSAAPEAPEATH
jgi:hypothetical protein